MELDDRKIFQDLNAIRDDMSRNTSVLEFNDLKNSLDSYTPCYRFNLFQNDVE